MSNRLARTAKLLAVTALALLNACSQPEPKVAAGEDLTIIRDDWGVPHIYADSEDAGYFGLGYAQAHDQGERVLRTVLMATGQLASIDGEELLASDIEARRWMHAEESRAGFERMNEHVQANYRAYAAGFNQYFRGHTDRAPTWRFDLEPWQLIAIPRGTLWGAYMAGHGLRDCSRGGVELAQGQSDALRDAARYASNEWVLHPSRTADDAIVLLSDPHGGIDGGFTYEYRMHAGELESAGYSFGGSMILPHTRHLTWGMTTGSPDVSDCFAVETDPDDPSRYLFDGQWQDITTRTTTIAVKDGESKEMTFEYSRHNGVLSPVIARDGDIAYVVSTPYMHAAEAYDVELDRLNHASTVDEAKQAMRDLGMFAQNLMFADSLGNSWYLRAGRSPRRPPGFDWNAPVPGNSSDSAWQGLHPVADLVQIKNPPQGYMQNNNLAPDMMTLPPALILAESYPEYVYNDVPGRFTSRGKRVNAVLSRARNFSVEDAIDLALDEKWPATDNWLNVLKNAFDATGHELGPRSKNELKFLRELLTFDGHARAGSTAALKYFMWRQSVFDQLSDEAVTATINAQWTPQLGNAVNAETLIKAVDDAIIMMMVLWQGVDATLGDLARIGAGEEDYPLGGLGLAPWTRGLCFPAPCESTLRAFWAPPLEQPASKIRVAGGSRLLRLVIFTDPIQSFTVHNFGQSDDPDSPHYDDQARLLTSKREVKPVWFERSELEGHIESQETLSYIPQ